MFLMLDLDDLWSHVMYMVLCTPDRYPIEDFLSDEDQMTMEKGYEQLHEGIEVAYPKGKYSGEKYDELRSLLASYLDKSRRSYESGDSLNGARLLQDFRNKIFLKKGKVQFLN